MEEFPYDTAVDQSFIGSPQSIIDRIAYFSEICGGEVYASVDVNYGDMPLAEVRESLKLFADTVMAKTSATQPRAR